MVTTLNHAPILQGLFLPSTVAPPALFLVSSSKSAKMMLVELPALDAVGVNVPALTPFSSFNFGVFHTLCKPSTWIVLLATLVILSSIRAAFLFVRPHSWTAEGRKSVSFSAIAKEESASKPLGVPSPRSDARSQDEKGKILSETKPSVPAETKKMNSWCWGLVKWESLPATPSGSERVRWQPTAAQLQETRRPAPAFNHPPPALYDTQVPISMAKLIMSHHTFRRPTNRPAPVRATNVPQYQRKTPSMV